MKESPKIIEPIGAGYIAERIKKLQGVGVRAIRSEISQKVPDPTFYFRTPDSTIATADEILDSFKGRRGRKPKPETLNNIKERTLSVLSDIMVEDGFTTIDKQQKNLSFMLMWLRTYLASFDDGIRINVKQLLSNPIEETRNNERTVHVLLSSKS